MLHYQKKKWDSLPIGTSSFRIFSGLQGTTWGANQNIISIDLIGPVARPLFFLKMDFVPKHLSKGIHIARINHWTVSPEHISAPHFRLVGVDDVHDPNCSDILRFNRSGWWLSNHIVRACVRYGRESLIKIKTNFNQKITYLEYIILILTIHSRGTWWKRSLSKVQCDSMIIRPQSQQK